LCYFRYHVIRQAANGVFRHYFITFLHLLFSPWDGISTYLLCMIGSLSGYLSFVMAQVDDRQQDDDTQRCNKHSWIGYATPTVYAYVPGRVARRIFKLLLRLPNH